MEKEYLRKLYASEFMNHVGYNVPTGDISSWYMGIKKVNRYITNTTTDHIYGIVEIYLDDNYMNHPVEYDADQIVREYQNDIGHTIDRVLDEYREDYDLSDIPDEITIDVQIEWVCPD